MMDSSFPNIESKFYSDELPQVEQNQLWADLSTRLEDIIRLVGAIFNFIKPYASKLFELSCKVVGIAITGINATFAKVENLVTYISQINLSLVNLAPQTTIHHHHAHYHIYSYGDSREEGNRRSEGLAY